MLETHYPTQAVCPRLVAALYTEAARLDVAWRRGCPDLPDDLDSRMVAAVLRTMAKRGRSLRPTPTDAHQTCREALGILRSFWQRNARRDWGRAVHQRGKLAPLSLSTPLAGADEPSSGLYGGDPLAGETGRAAVDHLVRTEHLTDETAMALVLHWAGYGWDEVVVLLARRGRPVQHAQVRQWGARYGERCRESLHQEWNGARRAPRQRQRSGGTSGASAASFLTFFQHLSHHLAHLGSESLERN